MTVVDLTGPSQPAGQTGATRAPEHAPSAELTMRGWEPRCAVDGCITKDTWGGWIIPSFDFEDEARDFASDVLRILEHGPGPAGTTSAVWYGWSATT